MSHKASSSVEVRFEPHAGELPEGTLLLRSGKSDVAPRAVPAKTAAIALTEHAGTTVQVEFRAAGWWSPQISVAFSAAGPKVVRLPVWRTGRVHGRVAVEGAAPPSQVWLVVETPPDPRPPPAIARGTEFRCPVNADGTWACDLPATVLDIAVRADGYTPHYRWGTAVSLQRPTDFGAMQLRKGASVLAWLDSESVRALRSPARAALVRMIAPGEASIGAARLATPVAEGTFTDHGVVQLTPIPAGVYMLVVNAEGFTATRAHPIEVDESRETVLRRAMTLERPLTARVEVMPRVDPHGAAWSVSLKRRSDFSSGFDPASDAIARTDKNGIAELRGQSPGNFALSIKDSKGNALFFDDWTLAGETAQRRVEVPVVEIEGTVKLSDAPVAAELSFGGTHGVIRIDMISDERGGFRGYLPRAGRWRVAVRRAGEAAPALVEVDVPDDGDVTIDLPDTSVSGVVLDSRGELVARARVTLLVPGTAMTARTDASGHFAFRSVPFGRRTVSAAAPDGEETSQAVDIELTRELREHAGIGLKLLPKRTITGRILSGGIPVIGARVRALPLAVRGGAGSGTSDTTGRFKVGVREDVGRVSIVVAAAGHALQAIAADAGPTPLTIELVRDGGTLLLDLPPAFSVLDVALNGVWIPTNDLFGWAAALGETRARQGPHRIPNVAPGSVRVCVTPEGESAARCRNGQLAQGGSLRLDLEK